MREIKSSSRFILLSAAALVLVAACGDTSTSSSPSTTVDPRSSVQVNTDKAAAQAAVLKLTDLPEGWTAQPNSDESASSPEQRSAEAEFADCAGVDPSLIGAGRSSPTRAKSDQFSDQADHQVESSVTVVVTPEAASDQLNSVRKSTVPGCLAKFVDRAIKSSIAKPPAGQTAPTEVTFGDTKVEALDLPGLHATSVGYRATVPVRMGDR
ncbi:MAG TPA: hypothetical protein VF711_04035, partial [Acidimicrobiales bacterium]